MINPNISIILFLTIKNNKILQKNIISTYKYKKFDIKIIIKVENVVDINQKNQTTLL